MKLLSSTIAAGLVCLLIGCTNQQQSSQSKRDLMAESGFKSLSLNTPAKAAAFKKLTPHVFTQTTFKGRQVWVYPEGHVCNCIYIGGRSAYETYLKNINEQMISVPANELGKDSDPYNPTQMNNFIQWDDPWDDSDAYGLYIN
ncbi:MAG: hypothetical protein JOY64_09015 [Alphaproteobacteria bacterium]|nr:hypothetical protein [Alphaproteobacteria bacterium]MBV8407756.1 hypothetical protein [Alphaproteobacteria bacterium]